MACTQPVMIDVACDPSALADLAVAALIDEACLTPKPALVDRRGSGAHRDLDLDTMLRSARSLRPTFLALARAAVDQEPSQRLREQLARIGREGEVAMLRATNGSNAHRGAIWIVGLLVAGASMSSSATRLNAAKVCTLAARIACTTCENSRTAPARHRRISRGPRHPAWRSEALAARGTQHRRSGHVVRRSL